MTDPTEPKLDEFTAEDDDDVDSLGEFLFFSFG